MDKQTAFLLAMVGGIKPLFLKNHLKMVKKFRNYIKLFKKLKNMKSFYYSYKK